jgi:hypothetical protein
MEQTDNFFCINKQKQLSDVESTSIDKSLKEGRKCSRALESTCMGIMLEGTGSD